MKFTGIVAPIAIAGAASAAAIPRADPLQGATGELHSTLGSVSSLVSNLNGCATSNADISQLTTLLKSIESKLENAKDLKIRQVDGVTDSVEDTASGAVDTADSTVGEVTANLKARQLSGLETTLQGVFSKVETGALTPQMILGGLHLNAVQGLLSGPLNGILGTTQLSGLEPVVKGVFSKIQSGALTPQMITGALNLNTVEGLLSGPLDDVLGNAQLSGLEPVLKGIFSKIQSGALNAQMITGALNMDAAQGLLNGPLSGLLGNAQLSGLEPVVKGVFSKISAGDLTPQMIMGAFNLNAINGLLTGVLGGVLGGLL